MVIALAEMFLSPTATLLEPVSNMQYVGVHCTLAGSCVQLEGSAIKLNLIPWLFSLMLPLIVVVEKGGKVIGLVVLIKYLLSGCACTSHFRLGGTTHCLPGFRNFIRVLYVNKFHYHISNSGAYCNRHPFLIVSGWQD